MLDNEPNSIFYALLSAFFAALTTIFAIQDGERLDSFVIIV